MTKKLKPMTAAERIAQLESDPEWVARRSLEEKERRQRSEKLRSAEAPLVKELRAAGFELESVWDLVNFRGTYPKAVRVLLAHLERPYPDAIRDGIVRALAVPETREQGWDLLLRLFRREPEGQVRQGLAVAISNAVDESVVDDLIALLRDRGFGTDRVLLLSGLERIKYPELHELLVELNEDPDLECEVQRSLRRLKKRKR